MMYRAALSSLVVSLTLISISAAQQPLRVVQGAGGFYGGYSYNVPQDPVMMLRMPQFVKELEVSDHQKTEIEKLQKEVAEWRKTEYAEYRKVAYQKNDDGERPDYAALNKEYQKAMAEIAEKITARLDEILLPHQIKRLKELQIQSKVKTRGAYALHDALIVEALEITDEQKAELTKSQREAQIKLQEEYQKLRAKYQQEVLESVLSRKQLKKLEDLQGEKYEVQRPDYSKIYPQRGRVEPGSNKSEK